jgi:RND family efflux transporter MFP subunit
MLRKTMCTVLSLSVFFVLSCGGNKDNTASMEQLHAENGQPVSVRKLETEDFSVFLKYPALIHASSESIAYAGLNDVVRTISARVGATVRQGDIIVSFSADNQILQQATLAHENARSAYNRTNALFRSNDVSRQDFDTVRMQYEISAANLKAANDMVYVKAPISGTLTQINVRVTENVRPGTPLFTVSNSNGFEAMLYVGADEIEKIQIGARAFIDLTRGKTENRIEGRITQVSLTMDSQKQCFPVTAVFSGGNRKLVSGMNVDIAVETYRNEKAIVLSRQELIQTETGPAAFVVEENRLRQIAVQTGEQKGLRLEITGGLNEEDLIVSEGVHLINAQSAINIVPAILPVSR